MNKKTMATLSLVFSIISVVALVIPASSITAGLVISGVCAIFGIVAIIFGAKSKKEVKGLGVAGMVIGIIGTVLMVLAMIGFYGYSQAKNCVSKGNGYYTCDILGSQSEVPGGYLNSDQIIK